MARITVPLIQQKKAEGKKITALTAYDFPYAKLIDEAEIDIVMVGDSVGIVVQGKSSTLSVTMDEMLYHTRMVSQAVQHALVIGDMPFMSYQISLEETIRNAGRFLKEGGAAAVKMEGVEVADRIEKLALYDIPVMGHIGLTPQSVHRMGGYKVQGREDQGAARLLAGAKRLESAGAFGLVLEGIPMTLARQITEALKIPTIGIGAGPYCDGQILVLHDLLGLSSRFRPKFVRRYADLGSMASDAFRRFKSDVESAKYPTEEEGYG